MGIGQGQAWTCLRCSSTNTFSSGRFCNVCGYEHNQNRPTGLLNLPGNETTNRQGGGLTEDLETMMRNNIFLQQTPTDVPFQHVNLRDLKLSGAEAMDDPTFMPLNAEQQLGEMREFEALTQNVSNSRIAGLLETVGAQYGFLTNPPPGYSPQLDSIQEGLPTIKNSADFVLKNYESYMEADAASRRAGLMPMELNRDKQFGFNPEELIKENVLWDDNARPSNLSNEIHPIFGYDHWLDIHKSVYEVMKPALRLASRMITSRSLSQFWVTYLYGKRRPDTFLTVKKGYPTDRIIEEPPVTDEAYQKVQKYFNYLGTNTGAISFGVSQKNDPLSKCKMAYFGLTNFISSSMVDPRMHTRDWLNPLHPDQPLIHNVQLIHWDMYYALLERLKTKHHDVCQILRFDFFLACLLLHELAHCIGSNTAAKTGRPFNNFRNEPAFPGSNGAETGAEWEVRTFGGVMSPINADCTLRHGLTYVTRPPELSGPKGCEVKVYHALPMRIMNMIQQEKSWPPDDEMDLEFHESIQFPHASPTALGVQMVTTAMNRKLTEIMLRELRADDNEGQGNNMDNADTIEALRRNLRRADDNGIYLGIIRTCGFDYAQPIPDLRRNNFPNDTDEEYARRYHVSVNTYNANLACLEAARRIIKWEQQEERWKIEEARVISQLDDPNANPSNMSLRELALRMRQ